jgi:hypothetical protein
MRLTMCAVVSVIFSVSPDVVSPAFAVGRSYSLPSGATLSGLMLASLRHSSRIELTGTLHGPGKITTHYVLRFQSPDRESVVETGGIFSRIQVNKKGSTGTRSIVLGKTLYRSLDGVHWIKGTDTVLPSVIDTLSVNGGDVPCCVAKRGTGAVHLSDGGREAWHGIRVYALEFQRTTSSYMSRGRVLVDAHSYLPVEYHETGQPPQTSGTFTFNYRSKFTIAAPS